MEIVIDHQISLKQISRAFTDELFDLVQRNLNKDLCYWCPDLKKTYASLETTRAHIDDANVKFDEDKTPDLLIIYNDKLPLNFLFQKSKVIPNAEVLEDRIVDHILWRYEF